MFGSSDRDSGAMQTMSAKEHGAAARRLENKAQAYEAWLSGGPLSKGPSDGISEGEQNSPAYLYEFLGDRPAPADLEHARQHAETARRLETLAAVECLGLPAESGKLCPFIGAVARVENLDNGVRVFLVEGMPVDKVASHMRCHHALAKARGLTNGEMGSCPLYLDKIRIRTVSDREIELLSDDPTTA